MRRIQPSYDPSAKVSRFELKCTFGPSRARSSAVQSRPPEALAWPALQPRVERSLWAFATEPFESYENQQTFCKKLLNFRVLSGAKDCESCRSRKMLKYAYLDAKIGVDAEENEASKVLQFYLILIPPRDLIFL